MVDKSAFDIKDHPVFAGLVGSDGVSLRDYFAAKALQGILTDRDGPVFGYGVAALAYEIADAMLKARSEKSHA